jgi:branched-chain amino acid transport system substrate-binding protein
MMLQKNYSRREFLSRAALAAGAAAATIVVSNPMRRFAAPLFRQRSLRIGVLLPRATINPDSHRGFLDGMKLFLAGTADRIWGSKVKLIEEQIGYGGGWSVPATKGLLERDKIDLAVGIINPGVTPLLHDLFAAHQTPFIAANIGANMPRASEQHPYFFYNTLNEWQASWTMGQWAAQNVGQKGAIVMSLYDSGFDSRYAFRLGFEAGGGRIIESYRTHVPPEEDNLTTVLSQVKQTRPDFVYAALSAQPAVDFLKAYDTGGLSGRVPLIGSGYLLDDKLLPDASPAAVGVTSGRSWFPQLDTPANRAFTTAYEKETGRPADAFALLGYETAQLVASVVNRIEGDATQVGTVTDALSNAQFESPRGPLLMNPQTRSITSPLYLRRVQEQNGTRKQAVLKKVVPIPEQDDRLRPLRTSQRTGWSIPYLV